MKRMHGHATRHGRPQRCREQTSRQDYQTVEARPRMEPVAPDDGMAIGRHHADGFHPAAFGRSTTQLPAVTRSATCASMAETGSI
jgi:hypothetical protein